MRSLWLFLGLLFVPSVRRRYAALTRAHRTERKPRGRMFFFPARRRLTQERWRIWDLAEADVSAGRKRGYEVHHLFCYDTPGSNAYLEYCNAWRILDARRRAHRQLRAEGLEPVG